MKTPASNFGPFTGLFAGLRRRLAGNLLAGLLTAHCLIPAIRSGAAEATPPPLKVMSFNLRYGTAKDGANAWEQRRDLVLETIRTFAPDLLGTQEVLDFQADFLSQHLRTHSFHGVGRDDGRAQGEYCAIYFRDSRFERLDSGHFWLSETPDLPGSVSWDSSLTRMCSWVLLRDRLVEDGAFVFGNTHWDHRGKQARLESARLIREKINELKGELPVILTGDFNTTEDDPPYAVLAGAREGGEPLLDAYRIVHPRRGPDEASFNGFAGTREGSRIDWILHSPEFRTLNAMIDHTHELDRYPSDHYPVEAVLRLIPTPPSP